MELARSFDELRDVFEELIIDRTRLGELLPVACRTGEMRKAFLEEKMSGRRKGGRRKGVRTLFSVSQHW